MEFKSGFPAAIVHLTYRKCVCTRLGYELTKVNDDI